MTRTLNFTYGKRPEGPLTKDAATARRLLGMTDESIRRDVRELKQWLNHQPDLPNTLEGVDTDWWLENYLIMNKNMVDRAKENLRLYFQMKNLMPDVMENRDPETEKNMIKTYNSILIGLIPTIMDGGQKLCMFMHRADKPASDYHPIGLAKHMLCMGEIYLAEGIDHTQLVILFDLETCRMSHLARYPIGLIRRFFLYAWKAYPERVAQIHIINPPTILSAVLSFFKPFLKAKIRKRIIVHRKFESLLEHIPLKYLPKEYGGESPSLIELHGMTFISIVNLSHEVKKIARNVTEQWRQKVIDYQPFLKMCVAKHRVVQDKKTESSESNKVSS